MMNVINSLIAALMLNTAPVSDLPPCYQNCKASPYGVQLVSNFEGYSPFVYKDSAGLPTIGIGHLIKPGEKFAEPFMPDAAVDLLQKDLAVAERSVNRRVKVPLRQGQADALISFTYNVGDGNFGASTLLKRVNAKRHAEVPPQFLRWTYAGGEYVPGLMTRRVTEADTYRLALQ